MKKEKRLKNWNGMGVEIYIFKRHVFYYLISEYFLLKLNNLVKCSFFCFFIYFRNCVADHFHSTQWLLDLFLELYRIIINYLFLSNLFTGSRNFQIGFLISTYNGGACLLHGVFFSNGCCFHPVGVSYLFGWIQMTGFS